MRQKTSITLDRETLRALDEISGEGTNRSRVIEEAILAHVARERRRLREERDRRILDAEADGLNLEVEDVLDFQAPL